MEGKRRVKKLLRTSSRLSLWLWRAFWAAALLLYLAGAAYTAALVRRIRLEHPVTYRFLHEPLASWLVFLLEALVLLLGVMAFLLWRELRAQAYPAGRGPLEIRPPGSLSRDEASVVQAIFHLLPDVASVDVRPLPGGYGESRTVQASLQREQGGVWPRSFVIKLGRRRELVGERDKFYKHVLPALAWAPGFFGQAECGAWAGIAYLFAGLGGEIGNFYTFYHEAQTDEIVELVGRIYAHLGDAWYQYRQRERVNLFDEYSLLHAKRQAIVGSARKLCSEDAAYLQAATADPALPWRDPAALLQAWPEQRLVVPIWRSTVHGDLHSRNVLIEEDRAGADRSGADRSGRARIWFIDFSHTGNGLSSGRTARALRQHIHIDRERGHTLRDFCRLEADVKFVLTQLYDENDLSLAVAFEGALMSELLGCKMERREPRALPPEIEALGDERFEKAWRVIGEIRRQAAAYLADPDDARAYCFGLLQATLPLVYYRAEQFESAACELQQKRYAWIAAGMLCGQL